MSWQKFRVLSFQAADAAAESLGQSWHGDIMQENFSLCAYQTIEPYFRQHLPRPGRIIEAGCGLGRWVQYLRNAGYDVCGIEYSHEAVALARGFDATLPITQGDVAALPFADGTFKAMISLGVLEHFVDGPGHALAEAYRVLSPGGELFISVPVINWLRRFFIHPYFSVVYGRKKRAGNAGQFFEYRFTVAEFARQLAAAGFTVVETVTDDFLPPKNMGLYADLPLLQNRRERWELNLPGRLLVKLLPDAAYRSGVLFKCIK